MHKTTINPSLGLVGTLAWLFNIQYFVAQLITANFWHNGFSLTQNTISDLGNTVCGQYGDRFVCSPEHILMNGSFVLLGITVCIGAYQLYRNHQERGTTIASICLFLSGIGTALVGLFPENTISGLHILGAGLAFLVGNIGLLVVATSKYLRPSLRLYAAISGVLALISLLLFVVHLDLGLGQGTVERLTAYPQTVWMIIVGTYSLTASSNKKTN